ncbi:MAG TPA: hypothetical protein VEB20_19605 [Azospirillaceae bacterium]|nr:hypothetical protein [Azospirillaceae bacterium]
MPRPDDVPLVYESPDRGRTIYARRQGDYTTRWRVSAEHVQAETARRLAEPPPSR